MPACQLGGIRDSFQCSLVVMKGQFQSSSPVDLADFRTNTPQNGAILRIERHVSCNRALVDVIENLPEYEKHRLRAVSPGEDHAAVHQRPLPVSHAYSRHAGRKLVLLAVIGLGLQEMARAKRPLPQAQQDRKPTGP